MKNHIAIRPPTPLDERAFIAAVKASASLHRSWVTPPKSPAQFTAYLERMALADNEAFLVRRRDNGELAGVVNVTHIVRGVFRSGYLGYYAFSGQERQGFMREGLWAVIRRAFNQLGLHRLEANIQPGNVASIALVRSCGFAREGYSPRYLKLGGRWRDHERWATLAPH
jgi:ribosomal-protein-alanine N-acetyltransferase